MFPFLPELLKKLEAAEEASTAQSKALRELIDYLAQLMPQDFRNKPSGLYRER